MGYCVFGIGYWVWGQDREGVSRVIQKYCDAKSSSNLITYQILNRLIGSESE